MSSTAPAEIQDIRDRATATATPRPPPTLESVRFDVWDRWGGHPGHGLTAARLVQIYRAAERGYPFQQCDLFDDVTERDGHLRAQLDMVTEGVAGKPWLVQPGGDQPEDLEAAELLVARLRLVPNLREMVEHQLTARPWGYAPTEILWDDVDGVFAPIWFENVPHRRIEFGEHGEPRLRTKDGTIPLEPYRWLFGKRHHRSTPMAGLLRTAVWWSLFKTLAARDAMLFIENYGLPTPVGTYGDATPPEEKNVLVDVVSNLGRSNYGVFHESCKVQSIKLAEGSGIKDTHGDWIDRCNAEISKLLSGATLTSGEGTSTGSYALGQVHENQLMRIIVAVATWLEELLVQGISIPFCKWNGLGGLPPRFKIQVAQHLNPIERLQVFETSVRLGVPVDADQYRTEMQLKPPTGEAIGGGQGPINGDKPSGGDAKTTAADVARKVMRRAA